MFEGRNIIVLDTETDSLDTETAKLKWVGIFDYKTGTYDSYQYPRDAKDIKEKIKNSKVIVGFNNKEFDNPIIKNNFNDDNMFEYKVIIDLLEISAPKGGKDYGNFRKNKLAQMGIKLKNFSLKNIIEILKLDDAGTKGDIDYKIFQKDEWTPEEIVEIKKYLQQDVELTKRLFQWYEEQFSPLKKFLPQKDQDNFLYLKTSLSVLAYNIICNKAGLKPEFGEKPEGVHVKSYAGGHHLEPRWDLVKGNIIEVDFACLHKDTNVITPTGNKKISELQIGDKVRGVDGFERVSDINKKKVKKLYKITLESGETVLATAEHRFPIKNIGDRRVDELKIGDDMITHKGEKIKGLRIIKKCIICKKDMLLRKSELNLITTCSRECLKINRSGVNNSNFKNKLYERKCPICNNVFMTRDCVDKKSCGKKECFNKLQSINNNRYFLGKTKENTPQLMKVSLSKKNIKRTKECKKNISQGTKIGMRKNWDKFIQGNKNKNKDFFKNPEWIIKNQQSRTNNIKKGKWRYKGINFRSSWERKFAQLLDSNNIKWNYEKKLFVFNNEGVVIRYLPDFYLSEYDLWIEIKGWKSIKSMLKYDMFKKENKSLLIDDINQFENEIQKIKNKEY